jgi:methyl-accepting chemotaxis protein
MTDTGSASTKFWVSALLIVIIISVLTAYAYTSSNNALKDSVRQGMKSTVAVMATQIDAKDLAGLKPGDENSAQYIAVVKHLQTMRSLDDHVINAYILKVNPDQTATFLVDDLMLDDPQGSAKIGEVSTSPDRTEIFGALSGPTASKEPYTTKYGSFMSAYAPIDDSGIGSSGNTYAVLAIDMSAKDYQAATSKGGFILIAGILSMLIALGTLFVFGRGFGCNS